MSHSQCFASPRQPAARQHKNEQGQFHHQHLQVPRTVVTVQEDVVAFTPAAPQRRITQAGAADLDGVVGTGLQIQSGLGFSRHGYNLETQK